MNNCIFCGSELNDQGICPNEHHFKKMCINCAFCNKENLTCTNEENLNATKAKMMEASKVVSSAYEIEINLKPLPLKKPTLKCGQWSLDEAVLDTIKELFE